MPLSFPTSRRGIAGVTIVLLWLVGMGALAMRELRTPQRARLAEAGLRVVPGDLWFVVLRDGNRVGYYSSRTDTSTTAIVLHDVAQFDATGEGAPRTAITSAARLSRSLAFQRLELSVRAGRNDLALEAEAEGDSALAVRVSTEGETTAPQRVPTTGRPVPPMLVPLLVALPQQPTVGLRVPVRLFDPLAMSVRPTVFRVDAESLFVVSDSAQRSPAGAWVSAHRDTVRAWHVQAEDGGALFAGWVDAQGRLVAGRLSNGLEVMRTSFEEAYLTDREAIAARGTESPGEGRRR